jgi:hypothetical protein
MIMDYTLQMTDFIGNLVDFAFFDLYSSSPE